MPICLLLLAGSHLSDGLKCYTCTVCNDPFNANDSKIEEKPSNEGYYCTKISAASIVNRGISQSCNPGNFIGNGLWCCQTDLCNHTNKVMPTSLLLVALIIPIFIKFL